MRNAPSLVPLGEIIPTNPSVSENLDSTVIPCAVTSLGSIGVACWTRFCTFTCAMLASEKATLPDEVASEVRGHFEDLSTWLAQVLRRGQSSGQLQLADSPATEAQLLMATVHGAMLAARDAKGE